MGFDKRKRWRVNVLEFYTKKKKNAGEGWQPKDALQHVHGVRSGGDLTVPLAKPGKGGKRGKKKKERKKGFDKKLLWPKVVHPCPVGARLVLEKGRGGRTVGENDHQPWSAKTFFLGGEVGLTSGGSVENKT